MRPKACLKASARVLTISDEIALAVELREQLAAVVSDAAAKVPHLLILLNAVIAAPPVPRSWGRANGS
jgi:hypothetical protein